MRIIEIRKLKNGAHRNQGGCDVCPNGWAVIPDDMIIPETFPFVDIEVEDNRVVGMTAGTVPAPGPHAEIEKLKAQLDATDYQAIKYAEGWITEAEYAPTKAQRQVWRDQINELEAQIKEG